MPQERVRRDPELCLEQRPLRVAMTAFARAGQRPAYVGISKQRLERATTIA
jgi:hypothetical protein